MDAIKFILNEHQKIRKSFKSLSKKSLTFGSKKSKFQNLAKYLVVHETMEQKKWYPVLKQNAKLKTPIKNLITEEKGAAKIIKKIPKIKSEEKWLATFEKLKKGVLHHANQEETKLFPKVRKALPKKELNLIGNKLAQFKKSKRVRLGG